MVRMLRPFADEVPALRNFNEASLAVLLKGTDPSDAGGDCVRLAERLRPLLQNETDSKIVAASLARGMRPMLQCVVDPLQRGLCCGGGISCATWFT